MAVLDLKARHSVVFIFSVIYILYGFYLSCSTSYLGVVGGWGLGAGAGAARFGAAPATFLSLIVF